jgi:hypothetical protein
VFGIRIWKPQRLGNISLPRYFFKTKPVGTATFCLSGTGILTVMHSGSGTRFGPGSNIKCNTKVKKIKKL